MSQGGFDKRRDAASYDRHAADYDTYIQRLATPLAVRICELAQLRPGDAVLDVGTGTGLAARQAARVVAPRGRVLGIDLSEGMIGVAARKAATNPGGVPPEFRVMDAESLDLPDDSFDAVISLCAVRHFPDIARALVEMRRVLRPGGHLVVSFGYVRPIEVAPLGLHLVKRLAGRAASFVHPRIVGPTCLTAMAKQLLPEPREPALTEWGGGDPRGTLFDAIRASGFEGAETAWSGHDVTFDSAEEFWEAQAAIVTEVRKRIAGAPPEAVTRLEREFLRKAESTLRRHGKLIYPYGAFYVRAHRPVAELGLAS